MQDGVIDAKYRILEELGHGAMGAVYLAEHLMLGQRVALKVVRSEFAHADLVPRFIREARAASSIGHPSIVRVFDAGLMKGGEPYLVMELLSGLSVEDVLERHAPLEISRVVELLSGPAAGLDLAHARGIVHRDIKPENLFVHRREDGGEEVKLVDFGLATFTQERTKQRKLTEPGTYLGTPLYMPPEAMNLDRPIDHRADVYALGVVAYELLTGEVPFDGDTAVAILSEKVARPAPPLSSHGIRFSDDVEEVVARALARVPAARQATCGAFIRDLSEADPATGSGRIARASIRVSVPSPSRPTRGATRVLLVEDDLDFVALVRAELDQSGFIVGSEGTVAGALERLHNEDFEAIVVDGLLPDATGVELISRLRTTRPDLAIFFVSGFWRDLATQRLLTTDLGVEAVLYKPVDPRQLTQQLRRVFPESVGSASTRPPEAVSQNEQLFARYLHSLVPQLEELASHLEHILEGEEPDDAVKAAHALAHRIKGTSGSYGLGEIAARARHIEGWLAPIVAERGMLPSIAGLRKLVEVADAALDSAQRLLAESAGEPESLALALGSFLWVGDDEKVESHMRALAKTIGVELGRSPEQGEWDGALVLTGDDPIEDAARVEHLRRQPGLTRLPVALVSEVVDDVQRLGALRAGASLVLPADARAHELFDLALRFRTLARAPRPRVLLVDDDPSFTADLAARMRSRGATVAELHAPHEILAALERHRPDILLLDVDMPGLSGIDACRLVRSNPRYSSLPILFVTAMDDAQARMECYWAGATDVLSKPVLHEELEARVGVRLERARLERERAEVDPLTGVLNRQAFLLRLEHIFTSARRNSIPLSVVLLDIDGLKAINDTRGHSVGDAALRAFASHVQMRLRAEDACGRWGGDELALALSYLDAGAAGEQLRDVLRTLGDSPLRVEPGEEPVMLSFSAGVACAPTDHDSFEDLLRVADRRLRRAKEQGKAIVDRG